MNCVRKKVCQPFRPLLTSSIIKIQPKSQYSVRSFCQTKSQLWYQNLEKINGSCLKCSTFIFYWSSVPQTIAFRTALYQLCHDLLFFLSYFQKLSCLIWTFPHFSSPPCFLLLLLFSGGGLQLDRSIYFTFYLCLSHSTLSLRFSISSGSSSISLLQQHFYPSITHLSKSTATDACRHAEEKTQFLSYCHVSEI